MWILFYDEILFALAIQMVHFAGPAKHIEVEIDIGRENKHAKRAWECEGAREREPQIHT